MSDLSATPAETCPTAAGPSPAMSARAAWTLILIASAIMMITTGGRLAMGLFVSPLNTATGLGIASISFAMAVGQFMWGASQPVFGAMTDKFGTHRVVAFGGILLAAGTALTPFAHSQFALIMVMGVMSAAGAGAGSFSVLIGTVAQRLPEERRAFASGFINAGGSFGQFVYARMAQIIIDSTGWVAGLLTIAASALLTIPLAWSLKVKPQPKPVAALASTAVTSAAGTPATMTLGRQVAIAFKDRSYLLLHAGFFTCGFHIAFLVTHLPGEVRLCSLSANVASYSLGLIGLFNIAGSLSVGVLSQRFRMKYLLALMYAARAVIIILFLLAPKTALTFYIFAAALGFTWLATVPPTAGLVAKLFGTRYMSTLFGLTLFTHQTGAFFGAWLGGIAFARYGDYTWMWYADIVLAVGAALINLPIREAAVVRRSVATA